MAALGSYGMLFEPFRLTVKHYKIPLVNLPQAFDGFTILQLTDIHYGLFSSLDFVKQVVAKANTIPKDIVVLTGDYVERTKNTHTIEAVFGALSGLQAPLGVLAVLGNHDHWSDTSLVRQMITQSGFLNLRKEVFPIQQGAETLWFAGAGDLWADHFNIDEVLQKIQPNEFRIVLAHNPDTSIVTYSLPVDLFMCGHTHGGQVVLPLVGAPVIPVVNRHNRSGLVPGGRAPVFVSPGIGCATLPVRVNCPPEISVCQLFKK